ncbi:MAG: hypothetical protein GY723_19525 [bacterium]|nr:hypothetical protein [bacterium]MCP5069353.1 hypothetical protein [bacterium]
MANATSRPNSPPSQPPSGSRKLASAAGFGLALSVWLILPASAAPPSHNDVPEPLRPWVEWVLRGHEAERCPHLAGLDERRCAWPARLSLSLDQNSGRFVQGFRVDAESEVRLPGGPDHWPEIVTVDGVEAAVVPDKDGLPSLRLKTGRHRVSGHFVWSELPQLLRIPPETGLVALSVAGREIPFPNRDAQGRLWLRSKAAKPAALENRLEVEVHRHVVDEIPLHLVTQIELRVSGESRERLLGHALPEGFVPLSLSGPIPAQLEPDGRLRVQVRPGRWTLRLHARHQGPVAELQLPALLEPASDHRVEGELWDPIETWVFEARPNLRLVDLRGATQIDPTQTELPPAWRTLPAFRMQPGDTLTLVEKRRGSASPARDELALKRTWHLDFDGRGATVADQIQGTIRTQTRLEMGAETRLGRAAVNDRNQPITQLAHSGDETTGSGIEVPLGAVKIDADSRVEGGARNLPATSWNHDFASLQASLELPPGWKLFHVSGADRAHSTWIGRWTLLDLFIVMVAAMAFRRMFGPMVGMLALITLTLTYTETGAPQLAWISVLAAEALRRVVPPGRLAMVVASARVVSLAALVLIALPFALHEMQVGLYPALERPWAMQTDAQQGETDANEGSGRSANDADRQKALGSLKSDAALSPASPAEARSAVMAPKRYASSYEPDPDARIPTGPGRPDWNWQTVDLEWSGPVEPTQRLQLWLLPPWANGLLALLRTGLLLALVGVTLGTVRDLASRWLATGGSAGAAGSAGTAGLLLVVVLGLTAAPASPAAAELPSPELLDELRTHLLEAPECMPNCVSIPLLALDARPEELHLQLEVSAASDAAFPLPGSSKTGTRNGGDGIGFTPRVVRIDGNIAKALFRSPDGQLWLRLGKGTHSVQLIGTLPAQETVELPLPWRPHRVEAQAVGWIVQGLRQDGHVEGALQLVRERDSSLPEPQTLQARSVPPFVKVVRNIRLGLTWQVQTHLERVAPIEDAIIIEVPVLPGERVTTAGVQVKDGHVLVSLRPGAKRVAWSSLLPVTSELSLTAPDAVPWVETWRVDVSPLWHVESEGIPWVEISAAQGRRLREWRPWPGENVVLDVTRPAGLAGSTSTLDASHLAVRPGLRSTDSTLSLRIRSSQGGPYAPILPEGAELTRVIVNGRQHPLRQEGREVPLTLIPGTQTVVLEWREPQGIGLVTRTPEIDLGLPSVNQHVELSMPPSRWTLWTSGPRLGPAVLFWPILALLGVLSLLLGRIRATPLRARHWFLLGIGLTQVPIFASGCVVVWLLALGWRREQGVLWARETGSGKLFDLMQLALAALTLAALSALFWSVENGLLGTPAMQIAGNGSSAELLRWYQDRAPRVLSMPAALSVSLWFYRLAMLAWSLWVAQALVGWLRWGWNCFSAGELWRPLFPTGPKSAPPQNQTPTGESERSG